LKKKHIYFLNKKLAFGHAEPDQIQGDPHEHNLGDEAPHHGEHHLSTDTAE